MYKSIKKMHEDFMEDKRPRKMRKGKLRGFGKKEDYM